MNRGGGLSGTLGRPAYASPISSVLSLTPYPQTASVWTPLRNPLCPPVMISRFWMAAPVTKTSRSNSTSIAPSRGPPQGWAEGGGRQDARCPLWQPLPHNAGAGTGQADVCCVSTSTASCRVSMGQEPWHSGAQGGAPSPSPDPSSPG